MNEQKLMDEVNRLARLCEAKDAEIERILALNKGYIENWLDVEILHKELSEAQEQIAMKDEALEVAQEFYAVNGFRNAYVDNALSATSESVAAWRAKETEPYKREVAMLDAELGSLIALHQNLKLPASQIAHAIVTRENTQATALAYEREVENCGAVKALERIIRGGCDLDFIEAVLEEYRAAK